MDHHESEKRNLKNGRGYFITFFLLLLFPLYGGIIDLALPKLKGVSMGSAMVQPSVKSTMDGSFQTAVGTFFEEHLPGKNALLRLRGQGIYSLLKTAPNKHVVRGQDGYLFEPAYLQLQTQIAEPVSAQQTDALSKQLQDLQQTLAQNGKELYVFLTPSKARFFPDKMPRSYTLAGSETPIASSYENFLASTKDTGLHVFDGISYLQENAGALAAPLFYKSGTHWSRVWADKAAIAFEEYIAATGNYDLATLTLAEEKSDVCTHPDADIYMTCNLALPPQEQYYDSVITAKPGTQQPSVLMRGGSFMFSLWTLAEQNVFGNVDYLENMTYRTLEKDSERDISTMASYDEMDLTACVERADIVILEVNEASIGNMSFGLLEYLENNASMPLRK